MSKYAIGLLAIIFLFLNLLLVNIERVAFKIRDYGYSHFHLGKVHASSIPYLVNRQDRENNNGMSIMGGGNRMQHGGYREVVVINANAKIEGIKESLVGNVKNALISNKLVANMVSPEMLDKFTKLLISDLLVMLEKSKVPLDNLKNKFDYEKMKENITGLLDSFEFKELKNEYDKLMEDADYNQLLKDMYDNLSSTHISKLASQTMTREGENFATLEENIRVNLIKDLEVIEVNDKSAELSKLLSYDLTLDAENLYNK